MTPHHTTPHHKRMRHSKRGNILFLILLAVVLFAALSYAVTSSMRGGGGNASNENLKLAASDLLNYFASINSAYLRMTTIGGLSETQINWGNTIWQAPNNSPLIADGTGFGGIGTACTEDRCKIFHPVGGDLFPKIIADEYLSTTPHSGLKSGHAFVTYASTGMAVPHVGTTAPEFAIVYQRVSRQFCLALNEAAGVQNTSSSCPPRGDTPWSNSLLTTGDAALNNQTTFCLHGSTNTDCTLSSEDGLFYLIHVVQSK